MEKQTIYSDKTGESGASVLSVSPQIGSVASSSDAFSHSVDVLLGDSPVSAGRDILTSSGNRIGDAMGTFSGIQQLVLAEKGMIVNAIYKRGGIRSDNQSTQGSVIEAQPNRTANGGEPAYSSKLLSERGDTQADAVMKLEEFVCPLNITFEINGTTQTAHSQLIGGGYIVETLYHKPTEISCRMRVNRRPEEDDTASFTQALSFHKQDTNTIWEMGQVISSLRSRMQPVKIVNSVLNEMGISYAIITSFRETPTSGSRLFEIQFTMEEVDPDMLTLFVPD